MSTIKDELNLYLDIKGVGRNELFFKAARRNVKYLVTTVGIRSLEKNPRQMLLGSENG